MFIKYSLAAAVFVGSLGAGADTIHFDQIEKLVKEKNPKVESSRLIYEAKKSREGSFARSFLPEVSAEVTQEEFKLGRLSSQSQSGWKVEAGINVFRGGADYLEEKVRRGESEAAQARMQGAQQEQLTRAYALYWDLLYQQEVIATLKNHLELSQKNLSEANRRVGAGVATSTDRMEFEMKTPLIRQDLAMAEKEVRKISSELSLLLGVENIVAVPISSHGHMHDWEARLKVLASNDLPEVKVRIKEAEILESLNKKAMAQALPAVDIYAGYVEPTQRMERDFADVEDRKESFMGIKATWSLGSAVNSYIERKSGRQELAAQRAENNFSGKELELNQKNRMEELKTLHSFVHDSEENIKTAQRYLEATRREYGRGVKNSPDMLEATEKYIQSKMRLAEILRDFNVKYSAQLALEIK